MWMTLSKVKRRGQRFPVEAAGKVLQKQEALQPTRRWRKEKQEFSCSSDNNITKAVMSLRVAKTTNDSPE